MTSIAAATYLNSTVNSGSSGKDQTGAGGTQDFSELVGSDENLTPNGNGFVAASASHGPIAITSLMSVLSLADFIEKNPSAGYRLAELPEDQFQVYLEGEARTIDSLKTKLENDHPDFSFSEFQIDQKTDNELLKNDPLYEEFQKIYSSYHDIQQDRMEYLEKNNY
jgi:hypothetical protein